MGCTSPAPKPKDKPLEAAKPVQEVAPEP